MKIEIDIKKEKLILILVIVLSVTVLCVAFFCGRNLGTKTLKTHVEKYDFLSPKDNLEVMLVTYKFINTHESDKNLRVTEYHAEIPFFVNVKSVTPTVTQSGNMVTCVANLTVGEPVIKVQKVIAEVEKKQLKNGSESDGVRKGIEEDKKLEEKLKEEIQSDLLMDEAKKQACALLEECIKKVNANEKIQVLIEEQNE